MIKITDKIAIDADEYQFIIRELQEARHYKTGAEVWKPTLYYATFTQCVDWYLNKCTREAVHTHNSWDKVAGVVQGSVCDVNLMLDHARIQLEWGGMQNYDIYRRDLASESV